MPHTKKQYPIHDENFKHNFSSLAVAHDFIKHNLPKSMLAHIRLDTVKIEPNEFLASRYRTKRSADMVYSVQDKTGNKLYALLHLEAQSRHDPNMGMRVWEYHVAIGRAHFRQGHKKIPLINTFVLYHGKAAWTSAKSISELFVDFDQYCACSLKAPFLIDLSHTNIATLQRQEAAAAPQIILKRQAKKEYCDIMPILSPLMVKYDQDDPENMFYMTHLDEHLGDQLLEKFSNFAPHLKNQYNMIFRRAFEQVAERRAQDIAKEKIAQGQKAIIQQLISSGIKKEEIARMLQMPLEEVEAFIA